MVKDDKGRYVIKAPFNLDARINGIVGIVLAPLLLGIPILLTAIFTRSIDFIFDEEKREMIVHRYGSFIRFSCVEAEMTVSYDNINDLTVETDYTVKQNGQHNGIIYLITRDGQKVRLTKGYLSCNDAISKKNRAIAIVKKPRP